MYRRDLDGEFLPVCPFIDVFQGPETYHAVQIFLHLRTADWWRRPNRVTSPQVDRL
jgi:hypothetical protein